MRATFTFGFADTVKIFSKAYSIVLKQKCSSRSRGVGPCCRCSSKLACVLCLIRNEI